MALYRKYRPACFADVVGQDHVTKPLATALDSGRINHAYLFSGPRGCGKTSSARIMARSLNCVHGPTSQPCGQCPSCISLAPDGNGNLDVTELDAASNRGVDDMRELRDRAYYAPAESRYRVFIIDEAHMITTEGANALLKIVEEPPEHLIFVFATTEPEKMLTTIRSRTHHYPFRLLTPQAMRALLEHTVAAEGATVDNSVYPLIIRAGGGSPRDSLSLLDQLLAGADNNGLNYDQAAALLGITNDSLLDAAVAAIAHRDYAALFSTVDDVIEAGFEPRQFSLDLLNRLRDLIVVRTVRGATEHGLVDVAAGRDVTLEEQAQWFSPDRIARMAALTNDALDDMRGATAARLLLEVLCARLLSEDTGQHTGITQPAVPSADQPASAATTQHYSAQGSADAAASASTPSRPQSFAMEARQHDTPQRPSTDSPRQPQARTNNPEVDTHNPQPEQKQQVQTSVERSETSASTSTAAASRDDMTQATASAGACTAAWKIIRKTLSERNERTAVMVRGAKVLYEDDEQLILGHHTGALANRVNAQEHLSLIQAVIAEVTGKKLAVRCVTGSVVTPQTSMHPPAAKHDATASVSRPGASSTDSAVLGDTHASHGTGNPGETAHLDSTNNPDSSENPHRAQRQPSQPTPRQPLEHTPPQASQRGHADTRGHAETGEAKNGFVHARQTETHNTSALKNPLRSEAPRAVAQNEDDEFYPPPPEPETYDEPGYPDPQDTVDTAAVNTDERSAALGLLSDVLGARPVTDG